MEMQNIDITTEEIITEEAPPKKNNKKNASTKKEAIKTENKENTTEYKRTNYKVIVDVDKDLDLLLICAMLNKTTLKACIENGEIISCGIYSNKINALKTQYKIEDLGYKAIIQEV